MKSVFVASPKAVAVVVVLVVIFVVSESNAFVCCRIIRLPDPRFVSRRLAGRQPDK